MNEQKTFDYGDYADCLQECYREFGDVNSLPVISSVAGKVREYYSGGDVLDLGCGRAKILRSNLGLTEEHYHSLDNDPTGEFTYRGIDEISEGKTFSLVFANQFLEHVHLSDAIDITAKVEGFLSSDGFVIFTVPNIAHPVRHWGNITHLTPWHFGSLYTLFKHCNLDVVEIARYSKRHPKGIIEKVIAFYINRIYRVDWCDSILIVGRKSNAK